MSIEEKKKARIVTCRGKEYIADDDYYLDYALSLEDNGTALTNHRSNFIINNFEHFERKTKSSKSQYKINAVELLHSLSQEMSRNNLSYEDEQYLDEIMGNDPMCMF